MSNSVEIASAWVVAKDVNGSVVIDGVYSSREKALGACDDTKVVFQFLVDQDYTDITEFMVYTKANPDGVMTYGKAVDDKTNS